MLPDWHAADWYGRDNRCTFGLIDRVNNKVTFWVLTITVVLTRWNCPSKLHSEPIMNQHPTIWWGCMEKQMSG